MRQKVKNPDRGHRMRTGTHGRFPWGGLRSVKLRFRCRFKSQTHHCAGLCVVRESHQGDGQLSDGTNNLVPPSAPENWPASFLQEWCGAWQVRTKIALAVLLWYRISAPHSSPQIPSTQTRSPLWARWKPPLEETVHSEHRKIFVATDDFERKRCRVPDQNACFQPA